MLAARHGTVLFDRGIGTNAPGRDAPITASTVFDIGSVAKSMTAVAVLQLVGVGKMKLDAPIARYLPNVPVRDRRITIERLLTHTSGLPMNVASDTEPLDRFDAVRRVLSARLGQPGTFAYSNAGYTLLADLVQAVSGMPFARYVRLHEFDPAGMTDTGWYGSAPPGATVADGVVGGADDGPAGSQEAPGSWATLGAGGIVSSASDLLRWHDALFSGRLLGAHDLAAYERGVVPLPGTNASVGLGVVVGRTADGGRMLAIGGGTDFGFTADLRQYPDSGLVTIVLSSTDRFPAVDVWQRLERAGAPFAG